MKTQNFINLNLTKQSKDIFIITDDSYNIVRKIIILSNIHLYKKKEILSMINYFM